MFLHVHVYLEYIIGGKKKIDLLHTTACKADAEC